MITFLVFSDWANPSQTIIEKTDGTHMHVTVLIRTAEKYRVQLEEPLGDLKKGAKLMIDRSDIAAEPDYTQEGHEWVAWVFHHRWYFAGACFLGVLAMSLGWFDRDELAEWMDQTWDFSKSIIPLLFGGVLVTGFVGTLIPERIVARWVGGDSFTSNLVASMIGGMWYFATLTEIPILEALLGLGMGRGPALALLLAGPALSLPSIAVIYSVIGFKKTLTFVVLTVIMSTCAGMVFGWFFV
ncbi:MAG: permease [Pirellulales bacterium]|nr:permease [Pirellulales bacterium]